MTQSLRLNSGALLFNVLGFSHVILRKSYLNSSRLFMYQKISEFDIHYFSFSLGYVVL